MPQRKKASKGGSLTLQMKTPTTPAEVYGAEVLRTGAVVPSPRTPAWTPGGASPRSRQPTAPTFSVRGDNYHFGLCTLHLRGLPAKYEDERALKHALAEMLQFGGSTAHVLQVTVRPTDSERSTAWALATFSSVMSANKILAKYESTSLANMKHKNSMGMLGHGFEVHALDVIKATKSRGQFKTIYEKSKRKAAAKMQQLIEEKQKAEHWVNKRRITPGGMDAPRKNIMPASYTFNTCTLHVGKIPTMKSLGAISTTKYEAAVAKLFQDRLEQHKAGKVVQVTIRHREYRTCRETGDEIPALSWGLVTLDSQSAVASVQQDDLSGLELNPIDLKQAYFSVGDFGRIFAEGQRRAGNYVAELKGEGKNLPLNSLQRHRHMRMTANIDLDRSLAGVEQPGTKLSSAKPGSSPQTSKETPLVGIASARPHTGSDRSHVSSGSDSLTYRHRGYATGQVCPSWFTPRMPSVKRPGRDLPDHWPTSPVSRERTHTKLMRLSQINLCGRSDADRKREVMRERRVERNRADDFAGYRAAFQLMDADSSGQVDPMEIVAFAERMGKRVDVPKFWKLYSSLDYDKSGDLDEDEFVKILDRITQMIKNGGLDEDINFDSEQTARRMPFSEGAGRRTHGSNSQPDAPGTETLSAMIEQRRQLADIYHALRTLRGDVLSQNIGTKMNAADVRQQVRSLPPRGVSRSRSGFGAPVPDAINMDAMNRFLDLFSKDAKPKASAKRPAKVKATHPVPSLAKMVPPS